mmetsp:Transcript_25867/g.43997  ORF Transcript_25867/g.43997 Transcript_25867/m.43997 type:complete len:330 (-) Transcript_25867:870-1859(-)
MRPFRSTGVIASKVKLSVLDLRGSGLSAVERLCLEESLLRHDSRNWAVIGTHEPVVNRYLHNIPLPQYIESSKDRNASCVIVMGIGGKPNDLLDVEQVKKDGVLVLKRFSGGGTVVLDHSSIWTTLIGRTEDIADVQTYPQPIMTWSAEKIFGPTFSILNRMREAPNLPKKRSTMVVDTKSCGAENSGKVLTLPLPSDPLSNVVPNFALRENDYVLGERKMGGNAQSIVKGGWLHHTSFLWDYDQQNMDYLSLPSKRPAYRGDRKHDDFLVRLSSVYPNLKPEQFVAAFNEACNVQFTAENVKLQEAIAVVGDMNAWFNGKCRTTVVNL